MPVPYVQPFLADEHPAARRRRHRRERPGHRRRLQPGRRVLQLESIAHTGRTARLIDQQRVQIARRIAEQPLRRDVVAPFTEPLRRTCRRTVEQIPVGTVAGRLDQTGGQQCLREPVANGGAEHARLAIGRQDGSALRMGVEVALHLLPDAPRVQRRRRFPQHLVEAVLTGGQGQGGEERGALPDTQTVRPSLRTADLNAHQ